MSNNRRINIYEYTQLIIYRANQLVEEDSSYYANPILESYENTPHMKWATMIDPARIAQAEYQNKKLPLKLREQDYDNFVYEEISAKDTYYNGITISSTPHLS